MPRSLFESRPTRLSVLYDGDCSFCTLTVHMLAVLDRQDRLEFVPLQHAAEHAERADLREMAHDYPLIETIHTRREDGRVSAGGQAVLEILDALPVGWLFRPWAVLPGFATALDAGYDAVARRRGVLSRLVRRLGGPPATCDLHDTPRAAGHTQR
jgi:predicted DCC family thiol-disulfide oxidoreductase YuxK